MQNAIFSVFDNMQMSTILLTLPDQEEHLTLIFVREEKQSKNGRVGDFVIGSLAMQLQERGKDLDRVSASKSLMESGNERGYEIILILRSST